MRHLTSILVSILSVHTIACVSVEETPGEQPEQPEEPEQPEQPEQSQGAPKLLTLGQNKQLLIGTADRVILSAALTDPNGYDDLAGGALSRVTDGVSIGAFEHAGTDGAYRIELDARTLFGDFLIPRRWVTTTLQLTAEFFDVAGNSVTKDLDIAFTCPGVQVFVDGACIEPWNQFQFEDLQQCVGLHAQTDLQLNCQESCGAFNLTCANADCFSDLPVNGVCACGPCL